MLSLPPPLAAHLAFRHRHRSSDMATFSRYIFKGAIKVEWWQCQCLAPQPSPFSPSLCRHVLLTSSRAIKSTLRRSEREENTYIPSDMERYWNWMWAPSIIIPACARKKKEFTFMVAYTWCGRWFPMFAGLFCVSVFNYGQLAGEKFVSLQLPVFYFSFFNLIPLPLYCISYLAGSIHSQNPIETTLSLYFQPELNLNWNFFAGGFLINAVTVLPASNCRSFFILYFFVIFAGTDSCLSHWLWDNLYQFGPLTVSQPGGVFYLWTLGWTAADGISKHGHNFRPLGFQVGSKFGVLKFKLCPKWFLRVFSCPKVAGVNG